VAAPQFGKSELRARAHLAAVHGARSGRRGIAVGSNRRAATSGTTRGAALALERHYFRLRRILCEFRSHSRGTLARYKKKIEHERILKNEIGRSVLNKLLHDEILSLQGNHYILDPAGLNTHLGVTWPDLRKGQMPESLFNYLREID
jgi:hypothetical protein